MDDLQSKISAIFSSPESMEQIRNLAQSLAGGSEDIQSTMTTAPQQTEPSLQIDPRIMQVYLNLHNQAIILQFLVI